MSAIQAGYKNITYHNKTHGADLCQTMNMFCKQGKLGEKLKLDSLEYLGIITAACVHDFEHPGVNNVFLQKI
jgi:3',5'-cyclic-nucleotide phosphodiesterase